MCRFPGSGKDYPVEPGHSILVAAKSARNHTESAATSIDLSGADFEVKTMEGSGNPDVPMLPIISNSTTVQVLNLLGEHIEESGKPKRLLLCDQELTGYVRDFCRVVDLPMVQRKHLPEANRARKYLLSQLLSQDES